MLLQPPHNGRTTIIDATSIAQCATARFKCPKLYNTETPDGHLQFAFVRLPHTQCLHVTYNSLAHIQARSLGHKQPKEVRASARGGVSGRTKR